MDHLKYWENPQITAINKLETKSTFYHFANRQNAKTVDRQKSTFFQSLNGIWKFKLFTSPTAVTQNFFKPSFKAHSPNETRE